MTSITKHHREEITGLINVYLDGLTSISTDVGWKGDSLMAKIIEFGGAIPKGAGNDQSNMSMINAIRMLKKQPPEFHKISSVIRVLSAKSGTEAAIRAILAKNYYLGLNPSTGKTFNDLDRLEKVEFHEHDDRYPEYPDNKDEAISRFRYNANRCAYRLIQMEIENFEAYAGRHEKTVLYPNAG